MALTGALETLNHVFSWDVTLAGAMGNSTFPDLPASSPLAIPTTATMTVSLSVVDEYNNNKDRPERTGASALALRASPPAGGKDTAPQLVDSDRQDAASGEFAPYEPFGEEGEPPRRRWQERRLRMQ
jgi:hypothetical protein